MIRSREHGISKMSWSKNVCELEACGHYVSIGTWTKESSIAEEKSKVSKTQFEKEINRDFI